MNRRGFLASIAAMAVAPMVKAVPVRQIDTLCRYKGASLKCDYLIPQRVILTRREAQRLAKIAGNFDKLKVPSYGQGGILRSL